MASGFDRGDVGLAVVNRMSGRRNTSGISSTCGPESHKAGSVQPGARPGRIGSPQLPGAARGRRDNSFT